MDNLFDENFYSISKGNLNFFQVIEEIIHYMKEKPDKFYDIVVGCDSSSGETPYFPIVVVVLRVGEGGRFFLKKIRYKNKKFHNWKERILEEVLLSCELGLLLREEFFKKIKSFPEIFNFQFRYIHADVGENGETRDMVKEVVGLIKGNGFEPKIKPEAFAATALADRYS